MEFSLAMMWEVDTMMQMPKFADFFCIYKKKSLAAAAVPQIP